MYFRRSIHGSRRTSGNAGFTLVELLTAMLLSGILLSVVARDFGFTMGMRHDMDLLVETEQGLRAAMSEITRELRQAGACLPTTGEFIPLDGQDGGDQDSLTLRVGRVDPSSVVCVRTILTGIAAVGTSLLVVQDAGGFESGDLLYLRGNDGSGETVRVGTVGPSTLVIEGVLQDTYADGTGVFAIEERIYEVDQSGSQPVLTVAVDGGDPVPLVNGVEKFNVEYLLTPCPPCSPIDEPADDSEWHQVREIKVEISVLSGTKKRNGEHVRLGGTTNVKPRNLL